jgi:hypothetical protein
MGKNQKSEVWESRWWRIGDSMNRGCIIWNIVVKGSWKSGIKWENRRGKNGYRVWMDWSNN